MIMLLVTEFAIDLRSPSILNYLFSQKDGYRCDDPCSQFTLCQGGRCHYNLDIAENQERRQCHCFGGFQGDYCDTDIDECALNICRNEAICINHIGTCSGYSDVIIS